MGSILGIVSAGVGLASGISQRKQQERINRYNNEQRKRDYQQGVAEIEAQQQESAKSNAAALLQYKEDNNKAIGETRANMAASGIDLSSQSYSQVLAEMDADSALATTETIQKNASEQGKYNTKKYNMRNNYMEQTLLGTSRYAWGGIGNVINQFRKLPF